MFRLISLLVVVAILAVLWLTVFDATTNGRCGTAEHPATTLSPELTKILPKGVAAATTGC